jgi:glycosyltransferase involved in cell wall biosynthesis
MVAFAASAGCRLVPPDDPASLRAEIETLLENSELRQEMKKAHHILGQSLGWNTLGEIHWQALLATMNQR